MKKAILVTLATVALTVGLVRPAQAALFVSISDGVATVSCLQGGACAAGFTVNGLNEITFSGTVGQYTIGDLTASSNNPGAVGNAALNVSTNAVVRNAAGTNSLFIWTSQNGFTMPAGVLGTLGNSGTASVTHDSSTILPGDSFAVQSWIDTTNATHNQSGNVPPGVIGAGVTGTASCGGTASGAGQVEANACASPGVVFPNTTPFSLTQKDTIFIISAAANTAEFVNTTGSTGVSAVITSVPEPGSLLLFGTGLIGLAAAARRRMRK